MIRNRIAELLEEKGKTTYWLAKECRVSYASMSKLVKNNTESVKFETIDLICESLDCDISDIFIRISKNNAG
nr:helix-turn-helix transcriptional regulator [uncultured Cellulosilyticum sp.]